MDEEDEGESCNDLDEIADHDALKENKPVTDEPLQQYIQKQTVVSYPQGKLSTNQQPLRSIQNC